MGLKKPRTKDELKEICNFLKNHQIHRVDRLDGDYILDCLSLLEKGYRIKRWNCSGKEFGDYFILAGNIEFTPRVWPFEREEYFSPEKKLPVISWRLEERKKEDHPYFRTLTDVPEGLPLLTFHAHLEQKGYSTPDAPPREMLRVLIDSRNLLRDDALWTMMYPFFQENRCNLRGSIPEVYTLHVVNTVNILANYFSRKSEEENIKQEIERSAKYD